MSQADVAFLLGKWRSEDVLRYEKSHHIPNLETALAYEAIFAIPVSELFGGLFQKIERKVAERKKTLVDKKKYAQTKVPKKRTVVGEVDL